VTEFTPKHAAPRAAEDIQDAEVRLEAHARELFNANVSLQRLADTLAGRIQELEVERARVLHIGRTDALTGLLNRGAFVAGLQEKLGASSRFGTTIALIVVDLDYFKEINDSLGHEAGDHLLQRVGQRLGEVARAGDLVARLGGDEFAVVAELSDPGYAAPLAARLTRVLSSPLDIDGRPVRPCASIGVALFPQDAADSSELQRCADMALYRAKSEGRNQWSMFDKSLREDADRRRAEEADLRRAVDAGEIVPWFQPVIDASSGQVLSLEVLARWDHRDGRRIGPDNFIPMAEELGLIGRIDEDVFARACSLSHAWVTEGLVGGIACNVSPRELLDAGFANNLIARLETLGFPPHALTVEITESFLLQDLGLARDHMTRLAGHGVGIALDDFGMGYSNLRALMQLPIDTVKIDRSLTADICTDDRIATLVSLLAQTTRTLGLTLIAEGVEEDSHAIMLRSVGCNRMQGFLFAAPMPAEKVEAYLRERLGQPLRDGRQSAA